MTSEWTRLGVADARIDDDRLAIALDDPTMDAQQHMLPVGRLRLGHLFKQPLLIGLPTKQIAPAEKSSARTPERV